MSAAEYQGAVVGRIVALVEPILADLGLQLYDCEHAGGVVQITVDKPGGVLLDELSLVTRLLSRELDHDDPVPGHYTLEVSSPGLERRLRRVDHYRSAVGSVIAIRLAHQVDGRRRVEGTLAEVGDDSCTIRTAEGDFVEVRYADVERARTVFVWGPAPKPGSAEARAAKASGEPERHGSARSVEPTGLDAEPASTHDSQEAAAS